ncbi:MAG: hypothetical protein ACI4WS_01830 [Oscillospiraceae bacterium]
MSVTEAAAPSGAVVEIIDSGWAGCTEAELERRRNSFLKTAAELCGDQQLKEQSDETTVPA